MKTEREKLIDIIQDELIDLHECDPEGFGCKIEEFTTEGYKGYRCKLRHDSLEIFADSIIGEITKAKKTLIPDSCP